MSLKSSMAFHLIIMTSSSWIADADKRGLCLWISENERTRGILFLNRISVNIRNILDRKHFILGI